MSCAFIQARSQRRRVLALQVILDLLDVGQEAVLSFLARPEGEMPRVKRFQAEAAQLGDLIDAFEDEISLLVIAGQAFARHDRRRLLGFAAGRLFARSGCLPQRVDLVGVEAQAVELLFNARCNLEIDALLGSLLHDRLGGYAIVPHAGDIAHGQRLGRRRLLLTERRRPHREKDYGNKNCPQIKALHLLHRLASSRGRPSNWTSPWRDGHARIILCRASPFYNSQSRLYGTFRPCAASQSAYQSSRWSTISAAAAALRIRSIRFVPMIGNGRAGCARIQA